MRTDEASIASGRRTTADARSIGTGHSVPTAFQYNSSCVSKRSSPRRTVYAMRYTCTSLW